MSRNFIIEESLFVCEFGFITSSLSQFIWEMRKDAQLTNCPRFDSEISPIVFFGEIPNISSRMRHGIAVDGCHPKLLTITTVPSR